MDILQVIVIVRLLYTIVSHLTCMFIVINFNIAHILTTRPHLIEILDLRMHLRLKRL